MRRDLDGRAIGAKRQRDRGAPIQRYGIGRDKVACFCLAGALRQFGQVSGIQRWAL